MHDDHPSSSRARSKRLRFVRTLAGLTRSDFVNYQGLNFSTYKDWEQGKHNGISKRGARIVIERLAKAGVVCSFSWLMQGVGDEPYLNHGADVDTETLFSNDSEQQILKELDVFMQQKHAVSWVLKDDAMAPYFITDDYVAGIKLSVLCEAIGQICIVQIEGSSELLLRKVDRGLTDETFTLYGLHALEDGSTTQPEAKLLMAAPVLWFRRKSLARIG